jgi:hypothetical protein
MATTFQIPELPGLRFPWYGRIPIALWIPLKQYIYQCDRGICQCGCSQQVEYNKSHCHHTLPLSEGGVNHPSNLKTLSVDHHEDRHPFMKTPLERLCNL